MPFTLLLYLVGVGFIFSVVIAGFSARMARLEKKFLQLERSLTLLMEKNGLERPSQLSAQVQQLARDPRRKIEAIKAYRTETGAGLREAKEAIEDFLAHDRGV